GVTLAIFVFLMTRWSAWVWTHVSLLPRLQFPWRGLVVVNVLAAALAAALPAVVPSPVRAGVVVTACALLALQSVRYTQPRGLNHRFFAPPTAASLAGVFFAPDVADEWLPQGAVVLRGGDRPTKPADVLAWNLSAAPVTGPAARCECRTGGARGRPCRIRPFPVEQGHLRWLVRTRAPCAVVLGHYFFPVGWTATLADTPIVLGRDGQGLMRVALPARARGVLDARFSMTPMRRRGLT